MNFVFERQFVCTFCNQSVADEQYVEGLPLCRGFSRGKARGKREEAGRGRAGNEGSRGALVCLCVVRLSLSMKIAQTNANANTNTMTTKMQIQIHILMQTHMQMG